MLSKEEKLIIEYGKKQGKSYNEVLNSLANYRAGIKASDLSIEPKIKQPENKGYFADLGGDIKDTFQSFGKTIGSAVDSYAGIANRYNSGQQNLFETALQSAGQGLKTAGGLVTDTLMGVGKAVLPQSAENAISNTVHNVASGIFDIAKTSFNQLPDWAKQNAVGNWKNIQAHWDSLPVNVREDILGISKGAVGAFEVAGGKLTKTQAINATNKTVDYSKQAYNAGIDKLNNLSDGAKNFIVKGVGKVKESDLSHSFFKKNKESFNGADKALKDPKTGVVEGGNNNFLQKLTENKLDPGDKKFLVNEFTPEEGKKWIDVFRKSEGINKHYVQSVPEFGLKQVEDIFKKYKKANDIVGSAIGSIKEKFSKFAYSSNEIKKAIEEPVAKFLEKKGYKLENGELIPISKYEVTSPIDSADLKTLNHLTKQFYKLVENPTGKNVERILDLRKDIDYNKPATNRLLKDVTKKLKEVRDSKLSDNERKLFKEYSDTIKYIKDFQKAKDLDAKLNIIMKQTGSASGVGRANRIAEEIKRVTGQDIKKIGKLVAILGRVAGKNSVNRTVLDRMINGGTRVNTGRILDEVFHYGKKKLTRNEIIDEIEKALTAKPIKETSKSAKQVKTETPVKETSKTVKSKELNHKSYNDNITKKKLSKSDKQLVDDIKKAKAEGKTFGELDSVNPTGSLYVDSVKYKNYIDFLKKNPEKFKTKEEWVTKMRASGFSKSQLRKMWDNIK